MISLSFIILAVIIFLLVMAAWYFFSHLDGQ